MQEFQTNQPACDHAGDDIYGEAAVWLCQNRESGFRTRISGALAQILKKYPDDYNLRLLKIERETETQKENADV